MRSIPATSSNSYPLADLEIGKLERQNQVTVCVYSERIKNTTGRCSHTKAAGSANKPLSATRSGLLRIGRRSHEGPRPTGIKADDIFGAVGALLLDTIKSACKEVHAEQSEEEESRSLENGRAEGEHGVILQNAAVLDLGIRSLTWLRRCICALHMFAVESSTSLLSV